MPLTDTVKSELGSANGYRVVGADVLSRLITIILIIKKYGFESIRAAEGIRPYDW
ncbi:MAG: hypothetical protein FWC80_06900 [Firmicutes bacterium]|nr:hypothetical protein [Bacillota bacterium]